MERNNSFVDENFDEGFEVEKDNLFVDENFNEGV